MLSQAQCHGRGIVTPASAQGPNGPVHRSLWLPNELDVVAVLVITAEMGQATARALCLTLSGLEHLQKCLLTRPESAFPC